MSDALSKNKEAFRSLFGSEALADRLLSTRIAVITPPESLSLAARLLGEVLTDTLARLWPNIDFHGAGSAVFAAIAERAAASGNNTVGDYQVRLNATYDYAVTIGCDLPPGVCAPGVRTGADDWTATMGPTAVCTSSDNPVGPAFAASLAATKVFRFVFQDAMEQPTSLDTDDPFAFDVRGVCNASGLDVVPLDLDGTVFFGVGAVSHGLLWLLEQWPQLVSGRIALVDPDKYGASNGQRYAAMTAANVGHDKVEQMRSRLLVKHPGLDIQAKGLDVNAFCAQMGYDHPLVRVVAGLDSAEVRRQVALKLPEHTINLWTEGVRVGASRYIARPGSACLACSYLEDVTKPLDEVAQVHKQTGLRPDVVRSLLDTGRAMTDEEARHVATSTHVPFERIAGNPLRSALPIVCAMGHIQIETTKELADVPFAFASQFAGIVGFLMLLKDLQTADESEAWVQHIFKRPNAAMRSRLVPQSRCVCCAELYRSGLWPPAADHRAAIA
jgi:Dinucleotide-utilizing enzymes involved in molybdopterin and thiamine biosynthesis family 2